MKNRNDDDAISVDPKSTTAIVCKCGNQTFTTIMLLRKVSALLSPNGKAGIIPVPTFACNACGDIPAEVVPPFLMEAVNDTKSTGEAALPPEKLVQSPLGTAVKKSPLHLVK